MSLPAGTRVGIYEVVGAVGAGGMGEVYRARDTRLNRDVALKVLPATVADDPERLARFRREAQVLASLNHPNIATVHGFEDAGGVRALVMELVSGHTLGELIDQRHTALDMADALKIGRQIAEALEAAHEHGIIHRDLKPANIKVRDDGTVKVLDFGLAKALDPESSGAGADVTNSPTLTARATQLGVILGTAAYMSPEQAKGKPVDRRADIWAFGIVLYEMLSGRRGYEAEDISETLAAVLTREVDWSALPAATPPRVQQLLRDCLMRDPKQRLRDIGEARRVLDQVISGGSASTISPPASSGSSAVIPASPPKRSALVPWAVAAIAVLVAAGATWSAIRPAPSTAQVVTRSQLNLSELAGFVDLSRDGSKLVYVRASGPQGFILMLRPMDQFDPKPIAGTEGGLFPVFSPDGNWVAFSTASPAKVRKINLTGGSATSLCDGSFIGGAAWGEDDTIVFPGPTGLMRVSANGGTPQPLTTRDAKTGETHSHPQFLPGGKQLLFTVTSNSSDSQVALLDLAKGTYRTVAKSGDNGRYVPTGHLTYVRAGTLFAVPFDLASATTRGPEAPVIETVSSTGPPGTGDYAFSPSGILVYSRALAGDGSTLSWADRKGKLESIPGQTARQWGTGRLSPDGSTVASGIKGEKGSDIWVADITRGTPTRLTFGGENDNPIWMPGVRRVAYGAQQDGKNGIYAIATDGSGKPELILNTSAPAVPTSFSPDGKTLLFTQAGAEGRNRVMVLPMGAEAGKREPTPLRESSFIDFEAQFSPDGKWVALSSNESGNFEIYLLPFPGPGAKIRVSNGGGHSPRWAPGGREIVYWTLGAGSSNLMTASIPPPGQTMTPGEPKELFKYFSGTTWDVTKDPNRFLVEVVRAEGVGASLATVTNWFEELKQRAPAKK